MCWTKILPTFLISLGAVPPEDLHGYDLITLCYPRSAGGQYGIWPNLAEVRELPWLSGTQHQYG